METCACKPDGYFFIKQRFWPATPAFPRMAFTFQFMDLLKSLFIESQTSVSSFCASISNLTPPFLKLLNDVGDFDNFTIIIIRMYYAAQTIIKLNWLVILLLLKKNPSLSLVLITILLRHPLYVWLSKQMSFIQQGRDLLKALQGESFEEYR